MFLRMVLIPQKTGRDGCTCVLSLRGLNCSGFEQIQVGHQGCKGVACGNKRNIGLSESQAAEGGHHSGAPKTPCLDQLQSTLNPKLTVGC